MNARKVCQVRQPQRSHSLRNACIHIGMSTICKKSLSSLVLNMETSALQYSKLLTCQTFLFLRTCMVPISECSLLYCKLSPKSMLYCKLSSRSSVCKLNSRSRVPHAHTASYAASLPSESALWLPSDLIAACHSAAAPLLAAWSFYCDKQRAITSRQNKE